MKNLSAALAITFSLILGGSTAACTRKQSGAQVRQITPMEAMGEVRNDFAVVVDVREPSELTDGMAQPAQNMPMSKIEANDPAWQEFKNNLPKDKLVVFYCAKGGRAGKVAESLAQEGYRTANMGGFEDWTAAGLPTKKP